MPRMAKAEAARLAAQNESSLRGTASTAEISRASGVMATWLASVNRPANNPSAASFAAKTIGRAMGKGIRTRKSVSSGNSEWLTRTVTSATIHIGRAMTSVVSAISARVYGSAVGNVAICAVLMVYIRTSTKPNARIAANTPISRRTNESAPSGVKTPKSRSEWKKCRVSNAAGRSRQLPVMPAESRRESRARRAGSLPAR